MGGCRCLSLAPKHPVLHTRDNLQFPLLDCGMKIWEPGPMRIHTKKQNVLYCIVVRKLWLMTRSTVTPHNHTHVKQAWNATRAALQSWMSLTYCVSLTAVVLAFTDHPLHIRCNTADCFRGETPFWCLALSSLCILSLIYFSLPACLFVCLLFSFVTERGKTENYSSKLHLKLVDSRINEPFAMRFFISTFY